MRITAVDVVHLNAGDRAASFDGSYDVCVVRIRTDEGLDGIGETESLPEAVRAVVKGPSSHSRARALDDVLIGRDPLAPDELWEEMYAATESVGRRGIVMHAIGAVDIALWDLKGKAEGRPVAELLGEVRHRRIPAYGTLYPVANTPEGVQEQIRDGQALNLRDFKLCADPWWLDDLGRIAEILGAAREAAGAGARLIVDAALSYTGAEAGLRLLPVLESAGVWFLEAPLPLDDLDGHVRMAGHGVALGVGDLGLTHADEFLPFLERGTADICQPDLSMVGGFVGAQRVAALARSFGKPVIPHGYKTTILVAANAHFLAVQPENEVLMEYSLSPSPLRWETTNEELPIEADGTVALPSAPGLGVSLNEDTVRRYTLPGR